MVGPEGLGSGALGFWGLGYWVLGPKRYITLLVLGPFGCPGTLEGAALQLGVVARQGTPGWDILTFDCDHVHAPLQRHSGGFRAPGLHKVIPDTSTSSAHACDNREERERERECIYIFYRFICFYTYTDAQVRGNCVGENSSWKHLWHVGYRACPF